MSADTERRGCETCAHWKPMFGKHSAVGACQYPLPFWIVRGTTMRDQGDDCPCWTARTEGDHDR
jgi:hypothetical protein